MQPDLEDLQITLSELEHLTELEISEIYMGRAIRPSLFRSPRRSLSFLSNQVLILALILIFCLPIGLILARSFAGFSGDPSSAVRFLVMSGAVGVAIALLWNAYLWQQTRRLKTLARLLDGVDQHNEMIQAMQIMDELSSVQGSSLQPSARSEVLQALTVTRESLVCGLLTEKILRKHQRTIVRQYELFAQIETNLVRLETLRKNHSANEYTELLNEALEIGLRVRREMDHFTDR